MTLDDIVKLLAGDGFGAPGYKKTILECGATHLAVDEVGEVYAWKGEPETHAWDDESCGEWLSNGNCKCVMYIGDITFPADIGLDWTQLLIKLP